MTVSKAENFYLTKTPGNEASAYKHEKLCGVGRAESIDVSSIYILANME